jgi:hypothetical protein
MTARLVLYSMPVLAGFLTPFLLARDARRGRIQAGGAGAALSIVSALVTWAAGYSFLQGAQLALYTAAISLFFAGVFVAATAARMGTGAAQVASGLILTAMSGLVFCSDLLLEAAATKAQIDRVVAWVSNVSPISVVGTILAEDPGHWSVMYSISRIPDYGSLRADPGWVCFLLIGGGAALLAAGFLRRKDGSPAVQPPDAVQAPR